MKSTEGAKSKPRKTAGRKRCRKPLEILFRGKVCSVCEISSLTGVSSRKLYTRLKRGWDIERAVSTPIDPNNHKGKPLDVNGEVRYPSEWSKQYGIPTHMIAQRLKYGWTAEEAVSRPVVPRSRHMITYRGKTRSLSEWAHHLGVRFNTLAARLNAGWRLKDALSSGKYRRGSPEKMKMLKRIRRTKRNAAAEAAE